MAFVHPTKIDDKQIQKELIKAWDTFKEKYADKVDGIYVEEHLFDDFREDLRHLGVIPGNLMSIRHQQFELLQDVGTNLLEINFPDISGKQPNMQTRLERIKGIFNEYLGWGRFNYTINSLDNEEAEITIQYPIFNTEVLIGILNGLLMSVNLRADPKRIVEDGYYRSEFEITNI